MSDPSEQPMDRRQHDKRMDVIEGKVTLLSDKMEQTCSKVDTMEPIVQKVGELILMAEGFFVFIYRMGVAFSFFITQLSKIAKILIPIGALLLTFFTLSEKVLNTDVGELFHRLWGLFR